MSRSVWIVLGASCIVHKRFPLRARCFAEKPRAPSCSLPWCVIAWEIILFIGYIPNVSKAQHTQQYCLASEH